MLLYYVLVHVNYAQQTIQQKVYLGNVVRIILVRNDENKW